MESRILAIAAIMVSALCLRPGPVIARISQAGLASGQGSQGPGGRGRGGRGAGPAAQAKPAGPVPRTADGKPDMNGIFSGDGGGGRGEPISFQPWAAEKNKLFVSRQMADNPTARCLSPGIVRLTTVSFFPIQFVQLPKQMVILYEWDHFFRVIPLDSRRQKSLDEVDTLQSLGHSVGKWEGDTLVVDVIGLSDYTWIGDQGGVHSDQLHIVERFTMLDADTIEWKAMLEDAKAWTKPWNTSAILKRRPPDDALMEYNCAENNKQDDFPTADKLVR